MSDVEKFHKAARKHFPQSTPWHQLNPMQQMQFIQGINMLIGVLSA